MQLERLRRRADFAAVQRQGQWWSNSLLTLRTRPNEPTRSRCGFLVSKRVGNAVARNLAKRRLKAITRGEAIALGWDMVFIARPKIAQASFLDIRNSVQDLTRRAHLNERPPIKQVIGATKPEGVS